MNRHEVIEAIVLERAKLLDRVDQLGADAERRPVTTEGWTAKDTLAHCIHWAGQMAWALGAPMHPPAHYAISTPKQHSRSKRKPQPPTEPQQQPAIVSPALDS